VLLGDAAGHAHPLTGEGIAYALWSAELLFEAFGRGDPEAYEALWRKRYGHGLRAASAMFSYSGTGAASYEMVLQMAMALALSVPALSH
jgi:flavin-dependent dehydrogenase